MFHCPDAALYDSSDAEIESVRLSPGTLSTMETSVRDIPCGPRLNVAASTRNTSWRIETASPRNTCAFTSKNKDLPISLSVPRSARNPPSMLIRTGFVTDGLKKILSAEMPRAPQRMFASRKRAAESVVDIPDQVARSGGSVTAGGVTTGM